MKPGDLFQSGHFCVPITDVTDDAHLVITPWPGSTLSGASYTVWKVSQQRIVGETYARDVDKMVGALNTSGFFVFVDINQTVPDPSLGDDGQYAFQPTSGKTWAKVAGVWSYLGIYKAFQLKGAWSGATAYAANDVVTLSGSSYACVLDHTNHTPPNATYWQLLAGVGATGATPLLPVAAWVTATVYAVGPPASYVTNGGSSYMCLTSHTSGTFATDLAAGKWGLVSQKGTDGTSAPTYGGTSTTSLAIGAGSKVFTTQAGLAYQNGARVRASSAANTANWMEGLVTYSGTTLTMTSDKTGGSGTLADWNFNVVGQPGAGDLTAANNLSDVANIVTSRGNLGILSPPQGRLTLASATPVMTTTQSAKTTLYYALYVGNQVPLYDGTKFTMTTFTELSIATTDTTKNPAAIGASKVNDWFVWNDSGTLRLSHGPDWTSDTVRSAGTALTMVSGVLLNNASITNGPAASRGTYVGTTRSNGSSQLDWILGGSGSGGVAGFLGVWNAYNRVTVSAAAIDSGLAYTYSSATVRQARASAGNQVSVVFGLAEDATQIQYAGRVSIVANAAAAVFGIGVDSTTAFIGQGVLAGGVNGVGVGATAVYPAAPMLGFHVFSANEQDDGTNANNFNVAGQNAFSVLARM
ncbi:hypothetical protein M2171_004714 [Bradyrhizobium japonicum USDA 38]|uniref:hypothetical protein n=1 Tax=Bradyrhizobium japonicum TaxID=375 RepID=UPI000411206A|nr:hypothetical protein [Bradyrhizobium japonicum]MCS3895581.1 hypothetical protein [Bradyrhizobium japonicum USDA 38]MCS3948096.1 hypothetical protein [Bradyrhizobium japonicum]